MNRLLILLAITLLVCCLMVTGYAQERSDVNYFTIVDESGQPVYITGWKVRQGDQCLTENNKRYEVINIEGNIAHAKYLGEVNLASYVTPDTNPVKTWLAGILEPRIALAQGGKVALYCTHSDESYVPTDGKESIDGTGGIFKVQGSFAEALKKNGLQPLVSNAKHDPHDDMAYERSRRTVLDLLKQQPEAIFDIHRDAVPPEVYKANINGQDVTKVQLVVGKYGPTGKQIEDYALQIKAAADQKYSGLVKGIFFAKGGDYNQDLHPRSMLVEVGAHTNDRPSAEKGIALFADVLPSILGKGSPGGVAGGTTSGTTGFGSAASGLSGASRAIGWIVGLLVAGTAIFLFLSTGSFKEAGAKLKQFTTKEFANFLGPLTKKSDKNNKDKNEKNE